jgi:oxygen-dependent protoporphyrinogen oxidase
MDTDVLIIGGGISGIATAWWLAQSGVQVEIWEKSSHAGGKIQSHQQNGYLTEQAASMIMNFTPEVDILLKRSGLDKQKQGRQLDSASKRYLLHKGQLDALPMSIGGMFLSPLWSSKAKLRLLTEFFVPRHINETETVAQFIKRRFGDEFLHKAMDPFIAGTLASDPFQANAMAVLPRLTRLEKKYGSISAGVIIDKILRRCSTRNAETFSFAGGISTLINHLLRTENISFKGGVDVRQLEKYKQGWRINGHGLNGEISKTSRQIVLATPAKASAQLLQNLDDNISHLLKGIEYAPLSVVHLGFDNSQIKHKLDSVGFLVPGQERKNITGNLWMSSLFANRAPQGKILLSSYLGGARQPQLSKLNDSKTIDCVLTDLKSILGIKASPEMARIDRHAQALPLYHGHYLHRIRALQKALHCHNGLNIVANFIGGVSIRDRIACAQIQARKILMNLDRTDKTNSMTYFNLSATVPVETTYQK